MKRETPRRAFCLAALCLLLASDAAARWCDGEQFAAVLVAVWCVLAIGWFRIWWRER